MLFFKLTALNIGTAFVISRLRALITAKENDLISKRIFIFLSDLLGYSIAVFSSFAIVFRDVKIVLPMLIPTGAFALFSAVLCINAKLREREPIYGEGETAPAGFLYRDREAENVWRKFDTNTGKAEEFRLDKDKLQLYEGARIRKNDGSKEEAYGTLLRAFDDMYLFFPEDGAFGEQYQVCLEGHRDPEDRIEIFSRGKRILELYRVKSDIPYYFINDMRGGITNEKNDSGKAL